MTLLPTNMYNGGAEEVKLKASASWLPGNLRVLEQRGETSFCYIHK